MLRHWEYRLSERRASSTIEFLDEHFLAWLVPMHKLTAAVEGVRTRQDMPVQFNSIVF